MSSVNAEVAGRTRAAFTPETVEAICRHLRETGLPDHRAALLAGVPPKTFRRWLKLHPELRKKLVSARLERSKAATPPAASISEPPPAPKPKPGRPTLFTPDLADRICAKIRQHGWSHSRACLAHGINPKNLTNWKVQHEDFAADLEAARSDFLADQLDAISTSVTASGVTDWRARAWLLERTFPEEYGRRAPIKVKEQKGSGWQSELPDDELTFDGIITPRHLAVLQRRRQESFAHMDAQYAAEAAAKAAAEVTESRTQPPMDAAIEPTLPLSPRQNAGAPAPTSNSSGVQPSTPKIVSSTPNLPEKAGFLDPISKNSGAQTIPSPEPALPQPSYATWLPPWNHLHLLGSFILLAACSFLLLSPATSATEIPIHSTSGLPDVQCSACRVRECTASVVGGGL